MKEENDQQATTTGAGRRLRWTSNTNVNNPGYTAKEPGAAPAAKLLSNTAKKVHLQYCNYYCL